MTGKAKIYTPLTGSAWIALGIIYLCFLAMYLLTPMMGDDLWFYKDYVAQAGTAGLTPDGYAKAAHYIWETDMVRIPNFLLLAMVAGLGNGWMRILLALFPTALIGIICNLSATISGARSVSFPSVAITWLLLIAFIPWWSNMFTGAMTLNYFATACLIFPLIAITTRTADKNITATRAIFLTLYAFVCGMMHEGATLCVGFGLSVWVCLRRFKIKPHVWLVALGMAGALLLILTTPILSQRVDTDSHSFSINLRAAAYLAPYPIITVLAWLIMWRTERTRSRALELIRNPIIVVCIFACAGGLTMWLFLAQGNPGTTIFPKLMMVVILSTIASNCLTGGVLRTQTRILSYITFIGLVALFTTTSIEQKQVLTDYERTMKSLAESPTGTVFSDITEYASEAPFRLLSPNPFRRQVHVLAMNQYSQRPLNVVPQALENFKHTDAQKIPGNAGLLLYRGILISPDEHLVLQLKELPCEVPMDYATYTFTTPNRPDKFRLGFRRFKFTAKDGTKWLYLCPFKPGALPSPTSADIY